MARRRRRVRKQREAFTTEQYSIRALHEEREYGMLWYAWLWKLVRPVMIFMCAALVVVGMVTSGWNKIYDEFFAPVDTMSAEVVTFEVESGSSVAQVAKKLNEEKLLRNADVFEYMVQFKGLTNSLSYGTYKLSPSMTVSDLVSELTSGSQTNERVITIIPGWTCEDIAEYLVGIGALEDASEFLALCNNPSLFSKYSYALSSALEDAASAERLRERKYALEGYLAPDTYRIFLSATPESILTTLLAQENKVVDEVFYGDAQYYKDAEGNYQEVETYDSGLSMDQMFVLASMIEKEAATTEDFARVSAVFHNRLKMGWKLESDPTATYLSGEDKLALSDADISQQNAYNTYVNTGLPVGPICNPSQAALNAAMNPDLSYIQEGYLYFCATEPTSGVLAFAKTKEEHQANVDRYRPLWEEYDRQNVSN